MGAGKYSPETSEGKRLLAHELTHVVQQGAAGVMPDEQVVQRQGNEGEAETAAAPEVDFDKLQMRKVISGALEGGKKVSDYYPSLAGTKSWGGDSSAGPFDNGERAGSVVQLIGEIPTGTSQADFTLQQMITVSTIKLDGRPHALEGKSLDDIARSGWDQSQPPFRQVWANKVSMCDPISGVPYNRLKTYDFAASAVTSIVHKSGAKKSVTWGVTIKARDGKVIENTVS